MPDFFNAKDVKMYLLGGMTVTIIAMEILHQSGLVNSRVLLIKSSNTGKSVPFFKIKIN